MQVIHSSHTASMTEVKRNLPKILRESEGNAVAILSHNKAEAYLVPVELYSQMVLQIAALEDMQDRILVKEREKGPFVEVDINDL